MPKLAPAERRLARAKDVLVGVVAATGLATAAEGMRFARSAPGGAVPLRDGDHAARRGATRRGARKRRLNVLGGVSLAAEAALVGVNAALGQQGFRRPPGGGDSRTSAACSVVTQKFVGSRRRRPAPAGTRHPVTCHQHARGCRAPAGTTRHPPRSTPNFRLTTLGELRQASATSLRSRPPTSGAGTESGITRSRRATQPVRSPAALAPVTSHQCAATSATSSGSAPVRSTARR